MALFGIQGTFPHVLILSLTLIHTEAKAACQWEGTEASPGPEVAVDFALCAAPGIVLQ